MDKAEQQMLVKAGWKDEGIGWYGDPNKTVGLYREYNPNAFANNHNYTTSRSEHDFLCSIGWKDESDNGKKPAWHAVAEAPKASAQALTAATISELLLQR